MTCSGASPAVPSTSSWPSWPISRISKSSRAKRTASRCTFVTSGHVASIACRPRSDAARHDGRRHAVRAEDDVRALGHLVDLVDEDRARCLELGDDMDVVHDLLAHVHRGAEALERLLDGDHRAVDTGAIPARRGQQHPLLSGDGDILEALAPPRNAGDGHDGQPKCSLLDSTGVACARAVQAAPPDRADSRGTPETRGPDDDLPGRTPSPASRRPPTRCGPANRPRRRPTSVARLNETIRGFIETWGSVWVEGEITVVEPARRQRLRPPEGPRAPTPRSRSASGRRTRERLPADLKVGDHVIACVKADYFVKSGDFSFAVSAMRHVGLGDQLEKLERLRAQLRAEGLFDPSRKKPLPFLPHVIGLITGEKSDAEKDVHRNAELRWPQVRFRTAYAAVQGDRCVPETIAALKALDADPNVDVIVIARGGGDPQTPARLQRRATAAGGGRGIHSRRQRDRPRERPSAAGRRRRPPRLDADRRRQARRAGRRGAACARRPAALAPDDRGSRSACTHDIAQLEQLRSRPVLRAPETMIDARSQRAVAARRARSRRGRPAARVAESRRTAELRATLRALSPASTLARGLCDRPPRRRSDRAGCRAGAGGRRRASSRWGAARSPPAPTGEIAETPVPSQHRPEDRCRPN